MAITTTTPSGADATYKAEIAAISGITISDSGTTQTQLQTALDSGVAKVVVNSDITTTSQLTVPSGVVLVINRNSTIECTANAHVIEIKPSAFVTGGGTVYNSNASSTSACLFLDGTTDTFTRTSLPTGASDLYLSGAGIGKGQGISLYAESDTGFIKRVEWTHFSNINIANTEDAMRLEANEPAGVAYVNGNMFDSIGIDLSTYGVRTVLTGVGTPGVTGNRYNNIQIQCNGANTTSAIVEGGTNNRYDNVTIFDFASTTALDFTGTENTYYGSGIAADEVSRGTKNYINESNLPVNMPYLTETSVQLIDPTTYPGGLVYNSSKSALCVAGTAAWQYLGGPLNEIALTATTNLAAPYGGIMITNEGATGTITLKMRNAVAGQEYFFKKVTDEILVIKPDSTGSAFVGMTDNYTKTIADVDGYLHVKTYNGLLFHVVASNGTITDQT